MSKELDKIKLLKWLRKANRLYEDSCDSNEEDEECKNYGIVCEEFELSAFISFLLKKVKKGDFDKKVNE